MSDPQLRSDDDSKAAGLQTTQELQRLVSEHHDLDERIHRLATHAYLTEQQQLEATQLKKRKLVLKDRIQTLLRGDSGSVAASSA